MTGSDATKAVDALREARAAISHPSAPARIDLRDHIPKGSPAWNAFVNTQGRAPGHNVKRATMIRWLDNVIGKLDGAVLDLKNSTQATAPQTKLAQPTGKPLRALTSVGIERALEFLADLRENPAGDREPPDGLLDGPHYSQPFSDEVLIERRTFDTRREAGEYLSQTLAPIQHRILDDAGVWSWLGMYYFADIVRVKDERVELHADETSLFLEGRAKQRRYRHYLWAAWRAWRLHVKHGEAVAFFLDQPVTDAGDIAKAVLDYPRVYTSTGVVPLILRLYTDGERTKRGFSGRKRANTPPPKPGNVWHLIERALPQLELTYDVYGMKPDALLEVLPPAFREWNTQDD